MSTVACPGCGMPRAADLIDETPCPVCGESPLIAEDFEPEPELEPIATKPPQAHNPASALPADASELAAHRPASAGSFAVGRLGVGLLFGFVLGAAAGVGGVLAWQGGFAVSPGEAADNTTPAGPSVSHMPPGSPAVAVAPAPREVPPRTSEPNALPIPPASPPNPEPEPKPVQAPPPPGRAVVIEVNEPDGTYTLPFPTRAGQHIVLKGKAKVLRLASVEGGSTVDASALSAGQIHVSKIDGGSTVKLNAPDGVVTFAGKVDGRSVVEVNAPGGEVLFSIPTNGQQEGSKIDGGSKVSITAKQVSIRGDIGGPATRVSVVLTRSGMLRVSTVQGTAVVEYRSANSGWSYATVTIGPVGPLATVRELGPKMDAVVDDD